MDRDRCRLVDVEGAVPVGQGYRLGWALDGDGASWPVLIDERQRAAQFFPSTNDDFSDLAAHELTGKLPEAFQQFYCGARASSTRRPCQLRVGGPGERCRHHVDAIAAPSRPAPTSEQSTLFELHPDTGT